MKKTYTGSCHCGAVRFEVDLELDHVRICDCSLCRKRGALNHRVEDSDIRIETPLSEMTLYQWHTGVARDYFCPRCGILPFRRPSEMAVARLILAYWGLWIGFDLGFMSLSRLEAAPTEKQLPQKTTNTKNNYYKKQPLQEVDPAGSWL